MSAKDRDARAAKAGKAKLQPKCLCDGVSGRAASNEPCPRHPPAGDESYEWAKR